MVPQFKVLRCFLNSSDSAFGLVTRTTGGIFHSMWTKCTTSNMVSLIFVFLMGCLIFPHCDLIYHAAFVVDKITVQTDA